MLTHEDRKRLAVERLAREVIATRSAVVLSVQHTGTWFALELLRPFYHEGKVFEVPDLPARRHRLPDPFLLQGHLKDLPPGAYAKLVATGAVITPLRDPLLALITRQNRHPYLTHRQIVDGFLTVAAAPGAVLLPIDGPAIERRPVLQRVTEAFGVAWDGHVEEFASLWPIKNTSGPSVLRDAYLRGSWDPLWQEIPDELSYLLAHRQPLREFLETAGYSSLSWWDL